MIGKLTDDQLDTLYKKLDDAMDIPYFQTPTRKQRIEQARKLLDVVFEAVHGQHR